MRLAAIACAIAAAILLALADQLVATSTIAAHACTAVAIIAALAAIVIGVAIVRQRRHKRP